jgi:hypothetical protein
MRLRSIINPILAFNTFLLFMFGLNKITNVRAALLLRRQLACPSSTVHQEFSDCETATAGSMINGLRSTIAQQQGGADLIEIKENKNLTQALIRFVALGGADWGYEDANISSLPPGYNSYDNFHVLTQNETFMNIVKDYDGLTATLLDNDYDIAHDTYKPIAGSALQIVRLRVNQGHCFSYTNCENKPPLTYSNFEPCSVYPNVNNLPADCLWFYWYYARMVEAGIKEFAWVKLHRPGRWVVNKAQTEAWLFVFIMNGKKLRVNNIPYQLGGACTKCPPEFSGCDQGLCVSEQTPSPTLSPSLPPTTTPTTKPTTQHLTRRPTYRPVVRHG